MIVSWFWWVPLVGAYVLVFVLYVRWRNRLYARHDELMRKARQRDIEDPGKEAVLTNLNTVVDYEKGQVLFRCQGCREIVHQVGDVEIPKGGLCMICSEHRKGIPIEVAEANLNQHLAYFKRVKPDKNGDPPSPKDVDEELAKQREGIAKQRAKFDEDFDEAAANLRAYAESLDKRREELDGQSKSLSNREYEARAKENAVTEREERVKLNLPALNTPAWARDALWGMGLSGIGLALAWVATLIF